MNQDKENEMLRSTEKNGKKPNVSPIFILIYKYRTAISNYIFLFGIASGVIIGFQTNWFDLSPEGDFRQSITKYIVFPTLFMLLVVLFLQVISDFYKNRWGEYMRRLVDLEAFSIDDKPIAALTKICFLLLVIFLSALGGYFTSAIHIMIFFYFYFK
jgi:hypothetical protein